MRVSVNSKLKRRFDFYNRKYFHGRLPKDSVVCFGKPGRDIPKDCIGYTYTGLSSKLENGREIKNSKKCRRFVFISKHIMSDTALVEQVLLHEMCHIQGDMAGDYRSKHGKNFNKRMLHIAKLGAFNGLW